MSFATDMQDMATELLTAFDERAEADRIMLVRKGEKVFDRSKAEYVWGPKVRIPLTGVVTKYDIKDVNGTTVRSSDLLLTVTNKVEVKPDDKIVVDGKEYSVVSPDPIAYTGMALNIGFKVQIRG